MFFAKNHKNKFSSYKAAEKRNPKSKRKSEKIAKKDLTTVGKCGIIS